MVAHAREDDPNECCGMLAGVNGMVTKLYRTRNAEASPTRYVIDSQDLFNAYKEMDSFGWELVGIYHSHTHTHAYPSATDVRLAAYPEAVYIIVSLEKEEPVIRGFRIVDGEIEEEELVISNA
jgi:proteasome lid subunit RPN8/RPN11